MTEHTRLDHEKEFVLIIDTNRTITACPTRDGATIVVTVEDVADVAIVEITQAELGTLIGGLMKLWR